MPDKYLSIILSGCGIIPKTFLFLLNSPAIFSKAPLGLNSSLSKPTENNEIIFKFDSLSYKLLGILNNPLTTRPSYSESFNFLLFHKVSTIKFFLYKGKYCSSNGSANKIFLLINYLL